MLAYNEEPRENKYIIFDDDGIEMPLLLTAMMSHNAFSEGKRVVSAGFFKVYPDLEVSCYGCSESLSVKSRPEADSAILRNMFVERSF